MNWRAQCYFRIFRNTDFKQRAVEKSFHSFIHFHTAFPLGRVAGQHP